MQAQNILDTAIIFYKCAVNPTTADKTYNQILAFARVLANPRPITTFSGNIISLNGGLAKTLVDNVEPLFNYQGQDWPIARPEAKQKAKDIFEYSKMFYSSLSNKDDYSIISNNFRRVIDAWSDFERNYLNQDYLNSLQNSASKDYQFWYDLRRYMNDTVSSINNLIKKGILSQNNQTQNPQNFEGELTL